MKGKREPIITGRLIHWIYGIFVLALAGFIIYSYTVPYPEDGFDDYNYKDISQGWYNLLSDGQCQEVSLPADLEFQKGNVSEISRKVPWFNYENCVLLFKSSHQDADVYIDGNLIYSYRYNTIQRFNKGFAPSKLIAIPFYSQYIGHTVTIRFINYQKDITYNCDRIYIGDKISIVYFLIRKSWFPLFTSMLLMIMGCILMIYFVFNVIQRYPGSDYLYMCVYMLFMGLWLLVQSDVRQVFFDNILLVRNMEFFSLMMIPIPFMLSIDQLEERFFHEWIMRICAGIAAADVIVVFLAAVRACTLLDMLWIIIVTEAAGIVFGALSFAVLFYRSKELFMRIRWIIAGHIFLNICCAAELADTLFFNARHHACWISLGMLVFCIIVLAYQAKQYRILVYAKQEAENKNNAKTQFLTNMSHEIRTPMNAVLGMDEMILRESTDPDITEYARDIQSAGKNLLAIINDILDISKVEAGKMEIISNEYELREILDDVVNSIRFEAEKKGLLFEIKVDEKIPRRMYGDEFRIRQIIVNLLNNAVKYTEKGKVELTVRAETYTGNNTGEVLLCIMVSDTGIGITKENQKKLFHEFERLSADNNIEGTGLGLAITSNLINMMNGTINLESTYGRGSVFTVVIPQKAIGSDTIGLYEGCFRNSDLQHKKTGMHFTAFNTAVLAVDDNVINLKLIQKMLKHTGIRTDTASSGTECLDRVLREHYDMILLDHLMPGMDGVELLHRLRELPDDRCKDTPIVVLTANAISGMKEMYLKEGFSDYLPKPISGNRLEQMILKYLPEDKVISDDSLIDMAVGYSYCMDDERVYTDILQVFCDMKNEKENAICSAYEKRDTEDYIIQMHSLKSNALTIGAVRLSGAAKELETECRCMKDEAETDGTASIRRHHEMMIALYDATYSECSRLVAERAARRTE